MRAVVEALVPDEVLDEKMMDQGAKGYATLG
jgi:hypothetical protein